MTEDEHFCRVCGEYDLLDKPYCHRDNCPARKEALFEADDPDVVYAMLGGVIFLGLVTLVVVWIF